MTDGLDLSGVSASGRWWYLDGIQLKRCKQCMGVWTEQHQPGCPVAACIKVIEDWRDDEHADSVSALCDLMVLFEVRDE